MKTKQIENENKRKKIEVKREKDRRKAELCSVFTLTKGVFVWA